VTHCKRDFRVRVKLFPIEFDPDIAAGPPRLEHLKEGKIWDEKETQRHRKIALEAKIMECNWLPPGAIYIEME
jgi:hypothetical protein